NPRLARIIRTCQDLPGQELFQYLDAEGQRQRVDSEDVNRYLREISAAEFTAKDFRTWSATALAAMALLEIKRLDSHGEAKKDVLRAVETVAERLGNTPSICRKCYIHPAVIDSYLDGTLRGGVAPKANSKRIAVSATGLNGAEKAVLALLKRRKETADPDLKKMLATSLKRLKRKVNGATPSKKNQR